MSVKRILYIQYTNPAVYAPLQDSSRILANEGWQVLFLGTGAVNANSLCFQPHPNIRSRKLRFCSAGIWQKLHYVCFGIWTVLWTIFWRPAWIYASDPFSCPIALALSVLLGRRMIYHEHDSPATGGSRFFRLCLLARRWVARRAVRCVLPNTERAKRFAEETGATNVICVWNCSITDEVAPRRRPGTKQKFWLHYHGTITPPQLPFTVLDALALLPDCVRLRVIGYETTGHPDYVRRLREEASRVGVLSRVEFLGSFPTRDKLLDQCDLSDVGLALFPLNGGQPMPGASTKPFDYMARGMALLVSDLPDWRKMYVDSGYALACDPNSPASIACAIRWFIEHPEEAYAMGEAGRRRILEDWNYENQFAPVLRAINGGDRLTLRSASAIEQLTSLEPTARQG